MLIIPALLMVTRSSAHAKEEKALFDAFLTVYRSFAVNVKEIHQPDGEFPDVTTRMADGAEIDFELGEWLDGDQMAAAKRRERLEEAILAAIGPQGENLSCYFSSVMLSPRPDAPPFAAADAESFRAELFALMRETEARWPTERFWHSPQGHTWRDLNAFPTLARYLGAGHFDPLVVRGRAQPWPGGQPYIFLKGRGIWYSPETALEALARVIDQKVRRYAQFMRSTRLLIYYGKAWAYNTPYYGADTRDFADVARQAAKVIRGPTVFDKIYLFCALTPGAEAFEIAPTFVRLD